MHYVDSRPTEYMQCLTYLAFDAVYREKLDCTDGIFYITFTPVLHQCVQRGKVGQQPTVEGLDVCAVLGTGGLTLSPTTAGKPELRTDEGAFGGPCLGLAACPRAWAGPWWAYPFVLLWMMSLCCAVRLECAVRGVCDAYLALRAKRGSRRRSRGRSLRTHLKTRCTTSSRTLRCFSHWRVLFLRVLAGVPLHWGPAHIKAHVRWGGPSLAGDWPHYEPRTGALVNQPEVVYFAGERTFMAAHRCALRAARDM